MIALIDKEKSTHLISDVHIADRQLQVPDYSVDEALEHATAPSLGVLLLLQLVYFESLMSLLKYLCSLCVCGNLVG